MDRAPPGEGLPASHDNVDVSRADLETAADAAGHFGRDQAGARTEKRVIDQLARPAVVDDRTAHALDRLLRGVSPTLLALSIAKRIVIGDLPHGGLLAAPLPVARLALAHRVPAGFMAPMVVAPAQGEMRFGPDDLSAQLKPAGDQIAADHVAVERPVPHISDIAGKQRIGLPPVGAVIVEHLALRELAGTDPTARAPGWIIADPIRWVAHHQMGLRSRQHRLDIRRNGAVTTADAMVSQQPNVAGLSDGLIGDIRDAVGIAETARPQTSQDLVEPVRLESGQSEVETAEFEITQLTAQQIGVPTPARGQFIVGQAIGLFFLLAPALRDDHRDRYRQPQLRRGGDPAVTGDQHALFVHQDRVGPSPLQDRGGDPLDVGRAVQPRVVRIGYQPFDRPLLDPFSRPWPCRARRRGPRRNRCHYSPRDGAAVRYV